MILARGTRSLGLLAAFAGTLAAGIAIGSAITPRHGPLALTSATASPAHAGAALTVYPVDVMRVIDGDTFDARVRAWPGIEIATKVRLRDIDAPELKARCEAERTQAQAASDALKGMLAEGDVTIGRVAVDKYGGRVLADAFTRRTGDVAIALLNAGLVRRYAGRRDSWC